MKSHRPALLSVWLSCLFLGDLAQGQDAPPPPPPPPPGSAPRIEERRFEVRRDGDREVVIERRSPVPREDVASDRDRREVKRRELERQLDSMRQKLKELSAQGRESDAREVDQHIARLEERRRQLDGSEAGESPRPEPRWGSGPGRTDAGVGRERMERIEHVRVAIDHLHAAGLHDVADRLAMQLEEKVRRIRQERRRFAPDRREGGPAGDRKPGGARSGNVGPGEPQPLQHEVQRQLNDLRRQLEELRRRLDQGPRKRPPGEDE